MIRTLHKKALGSQTENKVGGRFKGGGHGACGWESYHVGDVNHARTSNQCGKRGVSGFNPGRNERAEGGRSIVPMSSFAKR